MKTITLQDPEGYRFLINIRTEGCCGNPYFSITGDGFRRGGCLHDEILSYRPDLKPIVDLHLSDLDGVPVHAEANGWYWLAKAAGIKEEYEPEQDGHTCLQYFCEHCRIPMHEGRKMIFRLCKSSRPRKLWQRWMKAMLPRWKKEAEAGLAFIESL